MFASTVARRTQTGAGFIGTLCILSAFGLLGIMLLKCVPAYMEYFTIDATVHRIANDAMLQTDHERRTAFERQAKIDRIESVRSHDLQITGDAIRVNYEKKIPLLDHVSLLLDFTVSSEE